MRSGACCVALLQISAISREISGIDERGDVRVGILFVENAMDTEMFSGNGDVVVPAVAADVRVSFSNNTRRATTTLTTSCFFQA